MSEEAKTENENLLVKNFKFNLKDKNFNISLAILENKEKENENDKNDILLSVSDDKTLRIWSMEFKECINSIKTEIIQTCLGILKNRKFMVGGEDGSITIFNIDNFESSMTINAHNEPIEVLYESPFTGEILSGSQDNLVKIFNSNNGTCTKILEGHKNTILYITLLQEKVVITTSVDKTVKIWDI